MSSQLPSQVSVEHETLVSEPPPQMHEALELVQRIGGVPLLDRVVDLFRTTSRERMGRFESLITAGDAQQVSRLSHAMKGSAAQVGAESLRAVASGLEHEATSLDADAQRSRVATMTQELARALAQLERYRARVNGTA